MTDSVVVMVVAVVMVAVVVVVVVVVSASAAAVSVAVVAILVMVVMLGGGCGGDRGSGGRGAKRCGGGGIPAPVALHLALPDFASSRIRSGTTHRGHDSDVERPRCPNVAISNRRSPLPIFAPLQKSPLSAASA
jgi:hypothetical protein